MIRVVVVDDEPLAREGVLLNLAGHKDVEVVGRCANAAEAIESIRRWQPDLVFLDIKMPGGTGFDVVKTIGVHNMPLVVFLTAYDEYAIDAFKINALDYLLKPINPDLFDEALSRARNELERSRISDKSRQLSALMQEMGLSHTSSASDSEPGKIETNSEHKLEQRIIVRSSGHVYFIKPEEVLFVQADGDYIQLHTEKRSHLVRETMRNIETRLDPYGFQRIHRSVIVKVNLICEMITSDNGDYKVVLQNGQQLKMSRQYRDRLIEQMNSPGA